MKTIKTYEGFKRGEKIEAKIDLLKELCLDLTDEYAQLKIEVWNGTWKDNGGGFGIGNRYDLPSKSIIMMIDDDESVLDDNYYYENELKDKPQILELEERFSSFGMKPIAKGGFNKYVYFFFDKKSNNNLLQFYNQ